jgi:hypothetical protein
MDKRIELRDRLGRLAYALSALQAVRDPPIARYRLTLDGQMVETAGMSSRPPGLPALPRARQARAGRRRWQAASTSAFTAALALALLLLAPLPAACGRAAAPGPGASAPSGGTITPVGTPAPGVPGTPGGTPGSADPAAQPAIDAALADAANRLGVPRAQLRAARVERREWPDASLGCPQPGMMYAQVITPGYLVVVAGASKQLEYHTDTRGRAVFCRES